MSNSIVDANERQQALDPKNSFCVSAPAGSGKTELLIQRFLTLLAKVDQPEQVLAITFTRKAAAEMRERVMQALLDAQDQTPVNGAHEQVTRDLALAALARDQQANWNLLSASARFNIKTIDSFCSQLARQMPLLSAFGGSAQLVDDPDELYREAVANVYAGIDEDIPLNDDVAKLLLHFDNNAENFATLLTTMLSKRDQWLDYMSVKSSPDQAAQMVMTIIHERIVDQQEKVKALLDPHWPQLIALMHYASTNDKGPQGFDGLPETHPGRMKQWHTLCGFLLTADNTWRMPKGITTRIGFPKDTPEQQARKAEFIALLAQLREQPSLLPALEELRTLPILDDHADNWDLVLSVSRLLPQLAAHLLLVFQQHGQVDYTQVALSALDALGSVDSPSELAMRLDYGISHILVDEFQDTAINQYRLIERLTADWVEHNQANPDNPRTLMVVGDAMQSIYRFRNANVGLFLQARDQGFSGLKLTPLQLLCNFRSDTTLVHWVNDVFSRAFPQCDDIARSQVSYTEAVPVNRGGAAKPVNTDIFYGDMASDEEVLSICDQIEQGVSNPECRSIAVLGRSRKSLAPIMAELQARNVAYNAQEIAALDASPVVQGLIALFEAMANRADSLAWMSLLRAPWCGLRLKDLLIVTRHRQALGSPSVWATLNDHGLRERLSIEANQRLQALVEAISWGLAHRDRLSLRVWLEQIWLRLQGPACAQTVEQHADAQQVLQIIEAMELAGEGLSVSALKRRLKKVKISREVAEAKVEFMTLHKSKGLEFDWVFIPDLNSTGGSDKNDLLLWDESTDDDGHVSFLLAANDRADTRKDKTLYTYLKARNKAKSALEQTRLIYVGATRAVKRLFLSANLKASNKAAATPASPAGTSLLATIFEHIEDQVNWFDCQLDQDQDQTAMLGLEAEPQLFRLGAAQFSDRPNGVDSSITTPENTPERLLNWRERHLGTVIHAALEQLARLDQLPSAVESQFLQPFNAMLRQFGFSGDDLHRAMATLQQSLDTTLADQLGRWILSASDSAHCEWALTTVDQRGQLCDLIIDRSFVDQGVRWVVDYKSSSPLEGESLLTFLQREQAQYAPQLERYASVLESEGLPIKTALYFPLLGLLHEVDTHALSVSH